MKGNNMALLRLNGVDEAKAYFARKGLVQETKTVIQVTKPDGTTYTADAEPAAGYKKDMTDMGFAFKKTKGQAKVYTRQEVYDAFGTRHQFMRPEYRLWAFVYYSCTLDEVTAKFGEQSGRTAWNFKLLRTSPTLKDVLPLAMWLKIPLDWIFGEKVTVRNTDSWYNEELADDTADPGQLEAQESAESTEEVPTAAEATDSVKVEGEATEVAVAETEGAEAEQEVDETDVVAEPEMVTPTDTSLLSGDADGDVHEIAEPTASDIDSFEDETIPEPWKEGAEDSTIDDDQVDASVADVTGPEVNFHGGDGIDASVDEFLI